MSFCYLQFSQKTNEKIRLYYYGTSSRTRPHLRERGGGHKEHAVYHVRERLVISHWCKHPTVFVRFLGELKTPKRHFEINWPLDTYLLSKSIHIGHLVFWHMLPDNQCLGMIVESRHLFPRHLMPRWLISLLIKTPVSQRFKCRQNRAINLKT